MTDHVTFRTYVCKTKSPTDGFIYVRSDATRILVCTGPAGDSDQMRTHALERMFDEIARVTTVSALEVCLARSEGLALAALVKHQQKLILGTIGQGAVLLRRDSQLVEIVAEGFCAEGVFAEGDEYVVTTDAFLDHVGGLEGLAYYCNKYSPEDIVEMMQTYDEGQMYAFGIGLVGQHILRQIPESAPLAPEVDVVREEITVIKTDKPDELIVEEKIESEEPITMQMEQMPAPDERKGAHKSILIRIREKLAQWRAGVPRRSWRLPIVQSSLSSRTKRMVIAAICIALLVLGYGIHTYQKSQSAAHVAAFATAREVILQELQKAESEGFMDTAKASDLLSKIDNAIQKLQENYATSNSTELRELRHAFDVKRAQLLHIQQKPFTEYFDMIVEKPVAKITDVDIDGDKLIVLDGDAGIIYSVGAVQQSYDTIVSDKLKGAKLVTASAGYIYAMTEREGVYLFESSRSTQVIPPDAGWGSITDMRVFNSNIYMLDDGKKEIYKYIAIDTRSFQPKTSYLRDVAAANFQGGSQLAIDGSIYIAKGTRIDAFHSGLKSDIHPRLPYDSFHITDLYAGEDMERILVLDGVKGVLAVLDKKGAYLMQYVPDACKDARAALESKDYIYIFKGSKIYRGEK